MHLIKSTKRYRVSLSFQSNLFDIAFRILITKFGIKVTVCLYGRFELLIFFKEK